MIRVLAEIETQPGRRGEFLAALKEVMPQVFAEAGCLEYVPMVDRETSISTHGPPRENVVTVVEKWESIEALERHLVAPHMIEYRKRVKDLVAGVALRVLAPA